MSTEFEVNNCFKLVYDFSFKNEIRIIDGLGLRGDRGKMIHGAK